VTSRAWASARASIRRESTLCSGAAARPARVATAISSAIARGSAIESTPARRSRPVHEPSRYTAHTAAAAPSAPTTVPVSTSLNLA
jgi:hypothetical protein